MQRLSLALAALVLAGVAFPAAAIELKPHRAVYSLKLASAESSSGVVDAQGAMIFEWAESCESWIVRQKARFDMWGPEGTTVRTEVSFSSWERKSGERYGFNLRTTQDGNIVEDLRGEAGMRDGEVGGTAVFTRPEKRRIELPPGTLFPAGHTKLLIQEALTGSRRVVRPVFLGQREDEPMLVNAIISEQRPGKSGEGLLATASWDMSLAFYGEDDDLLPAFEIRERLYDNGVVGDARVIYDEFSFAYHLEQLEALPSPTC